MMLAEVPHIQLPGISAKWAIGSVALFHTAVASLAIGFAFVVTVLQIVGYRSKDRGYDLLAKRIQLVHVCIYNIGTINAIGLVFLLSGLYPQFWSQIFVHFFWPMIVEELCFFLLATTLTFHYFFWDRLWGHKRLHIFLGALLTPLFLLQFYIINGMGGFMLTPGVAEGQLSQWQGTHWITGWDKTIFYNPSFLMLTFHRLLANFSYGGFIVAAICGVLLYRAQRPKILKFYEAGGRMAFNVAFASLLSLPLVGFVYAWVLKSEAPEAYNALMYGHGDVVVANIDLWWVKHIIVISMIGSCLYYYWHRSRNGQGSAAAKVLVYTIGGFYVIFYAVMGRQMTWFFFWAMLACGVGAALLARHLLIYHKHSGRGLFVLIGVLSFLTVMLGGYVREASRPRFVSASGARIEGRDELNRYSHYDDVYRRPERQKLQTMRMVLERPEGIPQRPGRPVRLEVPDLITERCTGCHTLQRVRYYGRDDWQRVVRRMRAYGTKLSPEETRKLVEHFKANKPY